MGTINQMLQKVKSVDLRAEVPKIIEATAYEITALNQAQLYSGGNSMLERLTPYRSAKYAEKKNRQNPKPGLGNPDLFATGAFYKGMGVIVKETTYEITSSDSKAASLEKKYGEQIFGLADKNRSIYATGIFFERIKSYITGKTDLEFK